MVLTEAVLNECNNLSSSMHWSNIQARPFLLRKINWMQRTTYDQRYPLSNTRSITEYDIRIDFYKNKHPNIFVSRNDTSEYPNIFVWKETIRIWYEWIFVTENIRIYSNIRIFATPWSQPCGVFKYLSEYVWYVYPGGTMIYRLFWQSLQEDLLID